MSHQKASLVERLCKVQNPRDVDDWAGRNGYYVAECRVSAEDVPLLIDLARRWTDLDWPDSDGELDIDPEDADLLPVTAWRALADLKAEAAVQPLIDMLLEVEEEFDDWSSEELPHVFGRIGPSAIEPLTRLANDQRESDVVRSIAARGLGRVAHYHPSTRDRIAASLTEMMSHAAEDVFQFNSTLLVELVEMHAVEAAEPIERAFAANLLDVGMMGGWEDIRRKLGVEGLGLKMPESPYNSLNELRTQAGIGIFSEQPVFGDDEIDYDAAEAYYERAWDAFSESSEAQQVVDRHGELSWFQMLLRFGLDYLGEIVDGMTLGNVHQFVLDYVPRKVSTEADTAAAIVFELTMFWEYLDRVYKLREAKSIVEWLQSDGLADELKAELSDSSNFGMAKSFVMMGRNAGYDMTSQEGMNAFMQEYNQSLRQRQPPRSAPPPSATAPSATTIRSDRGQRVGRNDPCPCGSGKKFKKCCR